METALLPAHRASWCECYRVVKDGGKKEVGERTNDHFPSHSPFSQGRERKPSTPSIPRSSRNRKLCSMRVN